VRLAITGSGEKTATVVDRLPPPRLAVRVAWSVDAPGGRPVPLTWNDATLWPAAMVTDPGTWRFGMLLERVTVTAAGVGTLRETCPSFGGCPQVTPAPWDHDPGQGDLPADDRGGRALRRASQGRREPDRRGWRNRGDAAGGDIDVERGHPTARQDARGKDQGRVVGRQRDRIAEDAADRAVECDRPAHGRLVRDHLGGECHACDCERGLDRS
jgi:hypothetical protein